MNECNINWIKKQDLTGANVLLGIPGIGNVSNLSVDYLIKKLGAELICQITSDYLPNISLITPDSLLQLPSYELYAKKFKSKKIIFLRSNYAPINEYFNYKLCNFLSAFLKKQKVSQILTIAGIAYKEMPKTIKLHCAANDLKFKKKLEKSGLIFDGNKSVNLIIGSAGLLLTLCSKFKIPGACILASTFGHPQHLGIKESREVINFLNNYYTLKLDITDLDKEIKKINTELKKIELDTKNNEESNQRISRYIG
ncbi:MAG: PAC2 family protein [Candidatus Nanoarchaeia archaeon]|nr:PAC2 family protein [Candidatus Nanoarchaeia archaeon]